jgi:HlyD family secretion protein
MMKRTTLYVILGAILIAAVVSVVVWRARVAAQPEEETRSAVAERGTMLVAVSASGSVEPHARVGLTFELPGRVAEVAVKVGDAVEAGDVLARLETDRLALQVQQSQAALASVEAQLAQLRAGPRLQEVETAEANLRAAQAQVSGAAAGRDQLEAEAGGADIAAAEAEVASARLQQKVAQDAYDRIDKRDTEKKEQANYNLYAANEALAAAQARLDQVLVGADPDQIRAARANVWAAAAQRDAAQAQLDLLLAGATDAQIAAAEAQVAQAQATLEGAQLSLEQATLRAPFDGVVAEVNVAVGEIAATGLPAITLIDAPRFRVVVRVDEIDVGRLAEGRTAEVTLDALPGAQITGTVERIAPAATIESGVVYYDVVIGLAPTDVPVRADMTANATILVEELTDVLKVPTWVVRVDRDTGQTYVNRRVADGDQGDVERVDVQLGVRHGGFAQVLDGLAEGDEVVWIPGSTPFDFGGQ